MAIKEVLAETKNKKHKPEGRSEESLDSQIAMIQASIDKSLLHSAKKNRLIVMFSGGVDSGLLAARAAALGLKDTLLVNYCFGPDDAESVVAEKMARHLGLRFERIQDGNSGTDVDDVLSNASEYYSTPFCDQSAVPTCALVRAIISGAGRGYAVFDGTGADGAFGQATKARQWQRLYSVPSAVRRLGAAAYQLSAAWRKKSMLEHLLRLMLRTHQFRFPFAALAQNPFHGIAYHVQKTVREEVHELGFAWLNSLCLPEPHLQLAVIDMALVCAGIFAQKSRSLFMKSDVEIVYPFLSTEMFDIAVSSADLNLNFKQTKKALKVALARAVPPEMVYRAKSGFIAPTQLKFGHDAFLSRLDKLSAETSSISSVLECRFFRRLMPLVKRGVTLPYQTSNFLWGAVFISEWLEQVMASA